MYEQQLHDENKLVEIKYHFKIYPRQEAEYNKRSSELSTCLSNRLDN